MKLKISHQDFATLEVEFPRSMRVKGAILILSGLIVCFIGLLIAFIFNLLIGVLILLVGIGAALFGMPFVLKVELLIIQPALGLIERQATVYKIAHMRTNKWDLNYVSNVEAQLVSEPEQPNEIAVFINFKNGEKERVLTEVGEKIPVNCINYINLMIQNKEIPEGIFRD